MDKNLEWIAKGNTGCNFASIFAKDPDCIGWKRIHKTQFMTEGIPKDAFIVSILFDDWDWDADTIRAWANSWGFYEEDLGDGCIGLRYKVGEYVSWVQYFGPDSHVKTRQAPQPELLFCVKLPKKYYFRVGFKGILHLAHAAIDCIRGRILDNVWDTSFKHTAKILGHKPTKKEAAKTTFYDNRV